MLRHSTSLLAGLVFLAGTAFAQLPSNASLKGTYNFRYLGVNSTTNDVALSFQGTVTFDGTTNVNGEGTFTVTGQGAGGAVAGAPALNVYAVYSSGLVYMTNPFDPTNSSQGINTLLFGGIGNGAVVASSTDSLYCDLLVAVPVATSASTASLSGNYWIASLDFLGGNFNQTRNTFFSVAADGKGGLGNVTIKGTALIQGTSTLQSQTSAGATYTVSTNGTGTMTFPAPSGVAAANQLLAGAKSLIVSQDGSFFVAGGATAYDMIVGVKALTGGASTAANGLYFAGYLENFINTDGTFSVYGADGAANEIPSLGVEIGHQRTQPDFANAYDDTYGVAFAPAADGTVTYAQSLYAVGAGGNIVIGSGNGGNYQVTVYVKATSVSGTGVFLNPQGLVNNATNVPFTAGVSPGEFLSLYGSGLASQTATANSLPFPTTLGGVQVAITWFDANGNPQSAQAPVYFVSPGLVIILVPYTTPGDGTPINFKVTNNNAASNVATVYSGPTSPGIFTVPSGGIGNGAIEHADFSLVSPTSPAKVGETVQIFLTGMGATTPAVTAGTAAPSSPLAQTILPDVYIDGVLATTVFSGLTPGAAGLYQLNVTIPAGVTAGATVTIEVDTFDADNNLLTVNAQATIPISK